MTDTSDAQTEPSSGDKSNTTGDEKNSNKTLGLAVLIVLLVAFSFWLWPLVIGVGFGLIGGLIGLVAGVIGLAFGLVAAVLALAFGLLFALAPLIVAGALAVFLAMAIIKLLRS